MRKFRIRASCNRVPNPRANFGVKLAQPPALVRQPSCLLQRQRDGGCSSQLGSANVIRGSRGQLPPPVDDIEAHWSPAEKAHVSSMLSRSYVGSPETVREGLASVIAETTADELIVAAAIHDHSARVHSYEILANVRALSPRLPA